MIKKILISQPKPTSEKSPYFDIEKEFNVKCDFHPFFKVEGLTSKEFRQQKINILDYTAVVFTSRHAIDNFFKLAKDLRVTIPEDMKYFCVIENIAFYIQKYVQYRKRKVFFGNTGKLADLVPLMMKHKDEKYLIPMSSAHQMYRTVSNDFTEEEKKAFDYDMLLFFSPTGVKALKKNFPDFEQGDIKIGTFGTTTAQTVGDEGLRLDMQAPTKEHPSMSSALKAFLKEGK